MISSEIKTISTCKKELKITVSVEEMNKIREKQAQEVQKEVQVPGFRKGKAPRHMVQKLFAGKIEQYTLDESLEHGLREGLQKHKIAAYGDPVLKKVDFDGDKNLLLEVEIETTPEILLNKYKGFKLEKTIYKITEEDVDRTIDYLRNQRATFSPVETAAENGHFVEMDLQEVDENGTPLIGKKYSGVRIQLGDGQFDRDIETQLIGLKAEERKIVQKTYPENYEQKQFAGKSERYEVTIKKIENQDLPEVNDEFAKELDAEVDSVKSLKEKIRKQMEQYWAEQSEQRFYHNMAHEILQENPFDIPEQMIKNYLDHIIDDARKRNKNIDAEAIRKNYRTDAIFNIKWYHMKQKIADTENIKAEESDYQELLIGIKDEKIRESYSGNENVKKQMLSDLFEKKVFEFLIANSEIKNIEENISRKDLQNV